MRVHGAFNILDVEGAAGVEAPKMSQRTADQGCLPGCPQGLRHHPGDGSKR